MSPQHYMMNVALESRHQADQCSEWLERLASDEARVQVVTSSGTVTVSSKLLQLFSPLARETIASIGAAQDDFIMIPDAKATDVQALMSFLSKGQIDVRGFSNQSAILQNIISLAKCLLVNIHGENFRCLLASNQTTTSHPPPSPSPRNPDNTNEGQLRLRRMEELLRPSLSEAEETSRYYCDYNLEEVDENENDAALNFELDNNNQCFPSGRNDCLGNLNNGNARPSNLSTQPLPTLPHTEQSHQRPSVIMTTPSEAPTAVSRRHVGMPVLETIGSVTTSGSVELSRAPVFSCSTPKDSGRSDSLLSRASDTSGPLIGQGGTVPPGHPRRISRSVVHSTNYIDNYEDSDGESEVDNYFPDSEEEYESEEDSNDEESGRSSDAASSPQVPHQHQIPQASVSKTMAKTKSKIHSKSKFTMKFTTKTNPRPESQNRDEYQYKEFVRRFGQYVDITSEGLHKCAICEYVNPPKGKGRENVMEHVEKKHFPNTFVYTCPHCAKVLGKRAAFAVHKHRCKKKQQQ